MFFPPHLWGGEKYGFSSDFDGKRKIEDRSENRMRFSERSSIFSSHRNRRKQREKNTGFLRAIHGSEETLLCRRKSLAIFDGRGRVPRKFIEFSGDNEKKDGSYFYRPINGSVKIASMRRARSKIGLPSSIFLSSNRKRRRVPPKFHGIFGGQRKKIKDLYFRKICSFSGSLRFLAPFSWKTGPEIGGNVRLLYKSLAILYGRRRKEKTLLSPQIACNLARTACRIFLFRGPLRFRRNLRGRPSFPIHVFFSEP